MYDINSDHLFYFAPILCLKQQVLGDLVLGRRTQIQLCKLFIIYTNQNLYLSTFPFCIK